MSQPFRILISRTDAIGDVLLTLPLASVIRNHFPDARIGFLGKAYTKPVIDCCTAVDRFVDADQFLRDDLLEIRESWDTIIHVFPRKDIALKALYARIKNRIGTSSRPYHWISCNKLVKLSRRHSDLHEAQLNVMLLKPLGINKELSKEELGKLYALERIPEIPDHLQVLMEPGKRYVILHPKSQGSAREWGTDQFIELIRLLPKDRYQVFISGTEQESVLLRPFLDAVGEDVTDITGKMDLSTFTGFIARCDILVAASTGPLHIAAALGKQAIGIYPPIRPMDAGRWGPLGPLAEAVSLERSCHDCRKDPQRCHCMREVSPATIAALIVK